MEVMDPAALASVPETLTTPRLRLERMRADHGPAFWSLVEASRPDLGFVGWAPAIVGPLHARAHCARNALRPTHPLGLIYVAFEHGSSVMVADLDLHTFDFTVPRCELGYVGHSACLGRGLVTEAASALVRLAFDFGVERVAATCDARNERSINFALRLGFSVEGTLRHFERDPQGALCDLVCLSRLREERLA